MLKAARYQNPTGTVALGEGINEEEVDEILPMDINLNLDLESTLRIVTAFMQLYLVEITSYPCRNSSCSSAVDVSH